MKLISVLRYQKPSSTVDSDQHEMEKVTVTMRRRSFMKNAGLLLTGTGTLLKNPSEAQASPKKGQRILITSGESNLAQIIAAYLSQNHQVTLTGLTQNQNKFPYIVSELDHSESTNKLVQEIDTVVHVAQATSSADEFEHLDHQTRKTYNLLRAAATGNVQRFIFLSSLELMTNYNEDYLVSERWRPLPTTDPALLGKYLGEFTCREFAREEEFQVIILRLGKIINATAAKGKKTDPLWVEEQEVAQAVSGALSVKPYPRFHAQGINRWRIFHIQSEFPGARFSVGAAKGGLGYRPWFKPE